MRRYVPIIIFALALLGASRAEAGLLGTSCSNVTLGTTKMDTDGLNIVACLCNTQANCAAGDQVWKAMSSNKDIKCASGVLSGISNGQPVCTPVNNINYACTNPKQVITKIVNGVPSCDTPVGKSCPAQKIYYGTSSCVIDVCTRGAYSYSTLGYANSGWSITPYSVPAAPDGTTYSASWTCSGNQQCGWKSMSFYGTQLCEDGVWKCSVNSSAFSTCPSL